MRRARLIAAALLGYSALLLIFRHPLAPHWGAALQAPRLVTGAWALWVGMRVRAGSKGKGPEAEAAEPLCAPSRPTCERTQSDPGDYPAPDSRVARSAEPTLFHRSAQALPPSLAIGIALSHSAAASVVGGLWMPDWNGVRVVSAAGWVVALGIGWRAK